MSPPTIFDLCTPRADVLSGSSSDADFAADLSRVVRGGSGPAEYVDPVRFFATTYPTRGLQNLLRNVCARLSGNGDAVSAIFRLDTSFGGGKTHGLIALVHAARGMAGVPNKDEFVDPALLPAGDVRVAAFDGENADPANGRRMDEGVLAFTPWGEIAFALAGRPGYERVRRSDEERIAPGAETLAELFGDRPTLILLDELAVYLRKVGGRPHERDQFTAFLTALFKAVEVAPRAALVYTLAIGKDGRATDAYAQQNQFIAEKMAEAESVSARKATLLNPTEDDETIHVLRRRLFERIDDARATEVVDAYRTLWHGQREALPAEAVRPETVEGFRHGYPLHPDMLETFTSKTATLENFQRVRGMLRILGRTVARLWATRPADATAVHLHHIDPGYEPIRNEFVTRLGLSMYVPAIRNDVSAEQGAQALAQRIDEESFRGLPPYAAYVARTIFMHSLAFNDPLKGISPEHLRWSVIGPQLDISFVDAARQKFVADSAYLDDRPGAPLRFLTEANITQVIRQQERAVDAGEVRAQLNDRIRGIFAGGPFETVCFPGGPWEVPDEVGGGRPLLVVLSYDACTVGAAIDAVPDFVARLYERKGQEGGGLRALRNNLVFLVADDGRVEDMKRAMTRRLALRELIAPQRLAELAEHQRGKVREDEKRSEQEAAVAIQQCFRHLFYPSRNRVEGASVELAHTVFDIQSAAERPGTGQQQVVRALRELRKLRAPEDEPDAPGYVRDRTPLKKGQLTTQSLREEFRRDPSLPMLVGDDVFVRGIRLGVERGDFVYRRGELLYGQGDPLTSIEVDEQAVVFTMAYATEHGIWPRPAPTPPVSGGGIGGGPTGPDRPPGGGATGGGREGQGGGLAEGGGTGGPVPPPPETLLSEQGPLREALLRLWEQARRRKVERIATLTIRMFETSDIFRLLGVVAAIRSAARKTVTLSAEYETEGGSTVTLEFSGTPVDVQPVKEFLEPQLRAATDERRNIQAATEMGFDEGLAMEGDGAERLTEQLTRFSIGAAYVEATAEPRA